MQEFLNPRGWVAPRGYANGIVASGDLIVLGGQIGWNAEQQFESDDFVDQVRQTLENIVTLLAEASAQPSDVVRLTWFITDRDAYLANQRAIGEAYRDVMGRHFPTMSVVQVVKLMEARAKVEIEATAVIQRKRARGSGEGAVP